MEKNSKFYVAGHKGLVGSAIWRNLEGKGYTNLIGRSFEELDLRNQHSVETFFAQEKPEYVILAAAKVGGIMANNVYRGEFIYENLMIQNNVIHQACVHGVKKLLFLGSTCIYPRECPQPMKEEYLLTGPLETTNEPYAIAKIAGIKLCESYNLQYGTNFISVMPTNLYGPYDNFDLEKSHVLPALLRKIHLGKLLEEGNYEGIAKDLGMVEKVEEVELVEMVKAKLDSYGVSIPDSRFPNTHPPAPSLGQGGGDGHVSPVAVEIWGTGTPLREFMWSEDMADACVFLMEMNDDSPVTRPASRVTTFLNIGTGHELTISALAHKIKEVVGFRGELVFNASKPDGTMRKVTDVTRLHALGWNHSVEIEEGIRRLYQWYLERFWI